MDAIVRSDMAVFAQWDGREVLPLLYVVCVAWGWRIADRARLRFDPCHVCALCRSDGLGVLGPHEPDTISRYSARTSSVMADW